MDETKRELEEYKRREQDGLLLLGESSGLKLEIEAEYLSGNDQDDETLIDTYELYQEDSDVYDEYYGEYLPVRTKRDQENHREKRDMVDVAEGLLDSSRQLVQGNV